MARASTHGGVEIMNREREKKKKKVEWRFISCPLLSGKLDFASARLSHTSRDSAITRFPICLRAPATPPTPFRPRDASRTGVNDFIPRCTTTGQCVESHNFQSSTHLMNPLPVIKFIGAPFLPETRENLARREGRGKEKLLDRWDEQWCRFVELCVELHCWLLFTVLWLLVRYSFTVYLCKMKFWMGHFFRVYVCAFKFYTMQLNIFFFPRFAKREEESRYRLWRNCKLLSVIDLG